MPMQPSDATTGNTRITSGGRSLLSLQAAAIPRIPDWWQIRAGNRWPPRQTTRVSRGPWMYHRRSLQAGSGLLGTRKVHVEVNSTVFSNGVHTHTFENTADWLNEVYRA